MATRNDIQNALQQPYDQKRFASEVLKSVFGDTFSYAHTPSKPSITPTASEQTVIQEVLIYGAISLEDGTEITCYEILLQPSVRIEQSKVGIQQYVRKLVVAGEAALINFISPATKDAWRFTLVASDTKTTDEDIVEVKTNAKRYTYLVERERPNKTMADRMSGLSLESEITMDALKEAFSVEAMSKEFFREYKEHYQNFVEYLTGKRMKKEKGKWVEVEISEPHAFLKSIFNGKEKDARDFVKKLMGRIVFLYFVQKKRWLGSTTTGYTDGPFDFIKKLFDATEGNENFFPLGLSQLFFEALNKERPNDDWVMPVINKKVKIPYLNGGLFERDEIDELIHKKGDTLIFPPGLFSHVDKEDTPIERGFLDFLNAYNFTVYEDSEDDHTVAVDPEMLGHIFENLLEDNKDKGAFYTPKEIVHYMCQESLTEYLKTHVPDQEETIGALVRHKVAEGADPSTLKEIIKHLKAVKICDPAIGSGAFPMGLLQEIFSMREVIATELKKPFVAAEVKEQIISNSIYGVDIERGAVDIARLRFWLSLVVDEDKPKALPNLDYKIMQGNSLLESYEGIDLSQVAVKPNADAEEPEKDLFGNYRDPQLKITMAKSGAHEAIEKLIHEYFHAAAGRKEQIRKEIDEAIAEHIEYNLELRKMSLLRLIDQSGNYDNLSAKGKKQVDAWQIAMDELKATGQKLKSERNKTDKNFFLWHLFFKEVFDEGGFDIVIGNPPYVQLQNEAGKLALELENEGYQTFARTGDIYSLFYERGFQILKTAGIHTFITSNKWMRAGYGKATREYFLDNTTTLRLIDFGDARHFENATTYTNILIAAKGKVAKPSWVADLSSRYDHGRTLYQNLEKTKGYQADFSSESFLLVQKADGSLKRKIESAGTLLKDWDVEINYGIKTGFNDAFIVDGAKKDELIAADPKNAEIIKPVLRGRDIKKYKVDFQDLWLIFIPWHFPLHEDQEIEGASKKAEKAFKDEYSSIYAYIDGYKDRLLKRNQAETGIRYEWYALQRCAASYFQEFAKPKIVWGNLNNEATFGMDTISSFVSAPTNMLTALNDEISLTYLTGVLNSKLTTYMMRKIGYDRRGGYVEYKKVFVEQLPIPTPTEKTASLFHTKVTQILTLKKEGKDTTALEREIDVMVYKLYDLTWEETCIIEESEEWMSKGEYEGYRFE